MSAHRKALYRDSGFFLRCFTFIFSIDLVCDELNVIETLEKCGSVVKLALHKYHAVIASGYRRRDLAFVRLLELRRIFERLFLKCEFKGFGVTGFVDDSELPALYGDFPMVFDDDLALEWNCIADSHRLLAFRLYKAGAAKKSQRNGISHAGLHR
jgi:hypothetical protein